MRRQGTFAAGVVTLAVSLAFAPGDARSQDVAEFFRDKNVTIVLPVGPGGSFHLYAQIVAKHMAQYIPGSPTVIIQNRPGAGGAVSAAYVSNAAPKDGTVIGKIVPGMLTYPLLRAGANYDATTFQYLGAIAARDFSLAVWHTAPAQTWEDLKTREITFAATGRAASSYTVPAFINGVLGAKMKIITGYGSGGDLNIAMERGEAQGRGNFYSGFASVRPDWIEEKKIRFLLTMGPENPALKGVPRVRDLLKPGSVEAKAFGLLEASFNQGQAFYVADAVPRDRMLALRKAFAQAMADPALQKECEERKLDFNPISGEGLEKIVAEGMAPSSEPEVLKKFRELMGVTEGS
jgi:tripartite-type tricarboxylate transporter receptor subunit TctC